MITLHTLTKTKDRSKKRLGRGHGSGKVKTGGRGTKGQRARGSISFRMGLAGVSLTKRLPLFRGKYRNKSHQKKEIIVNLKYLSGALKNAVIDEAYLIKHHIVTKEGVETCGVKILGNGAIEVPLTIQVPISKSAASKVEKAGGSIENK